MENSKISASERKKTLTSYVTGFILSILLTVVPYFLVTNHLLSPEILVGVILIFAFIQLTVQLLFFLHMRQESKPRLNLVIFISFFGIILIVVVASIWIMQHLNYSMNLLQLNTVMQQGEGF
jgi:cytochrome o ubiquinol oxidase operon protein cyoD